MAEEANVNTTAQETSSGAVKAAQDAMNVNTPADNKNDSSTVSDADNGNTDLENLIQRAVDRATNKLGNENKKLRGQIDELKKAKLSDDELKQLQIQEKEQEIAERERALQEKENRLIAIKAIKEIGLDDGSDAALSLVDFVMADDEDAIKERVKAFDVLVKRFVQSNVDKVFKQNGRTPMKGSSGAAKDDNKSDSVAARIGQNVAKANKAAQSTLDYYLGGKK